MYMKAQKNSYQALLVMSGLQGEICLLKKDRVIELTGLWNFVSFSIL